MNLDSRARLTLVDGLRGIAACAVMLYHYESGPLRPTLLECLPWPLFGLVGHGWLGVHVFFVLSGFVIAYAIGDRRVTPRGALRFVLRRQVRLDPPYWASIALAAGFSWYLRLEYGGDRAAPSAGDIVRQMLYVQEIVGAPPVQVVYWSLAIEVQFYLVFVAVLAACGLVPRLRALPSAPAWICAVTGAFSLMALVDGWVRPVWVVIDWYLFALGACAYWTLVARFSRPVFLAALVAVSLEGWHREHLEPCVGASVAALLYTAGRRDALTKWLRGNVWQTLGRLSYTIYLVHTVVGAMTRSQLGRRVRDSDPMGALVVIVCAVTASLAAAWLLHVAVEKPAIRWASRIRWA